MSTVNSSVRRPGLITLVLVLVIIGGVLSILAGIIAMIAFNGATIAGIVLVLLGLVYFAVAKGLADGNNMSRIVVAVVSALQVAFALITIINTDDGGTRSSAISSGVAALVILLILFSPKANAFFESR